ncbi:MAG: hypothetical protein COV79_01150 [Parcubacteria group bacterium CG11_big_fil_rev_8_21_14_0_20_41_14]|nr:MAG: hypothetical protein COV79_01150 [Parcubacteria group bacterium CG11_big_fil_rev_8_21_14_0_20_41_14]
MTENNKLDLPVDGKSWWQKLVGGVPELTTGEKKRVSSGSEEVYLAAQEADDANKLIRIAKRTGDNEMINFPRPYGRGIS